VLDPVDDVVNLVLCHHPPDWFMDQDDVRDAICDRAAIHLFGHMHRQRVTQDPNYIRLAAGAVNPDRNEAGWQSGYDLIRVEVTGVGQDRAVEIEAHLLEWQSNREQYRPALTRQGEAVVRHRISIPDPTPTMAIGISYQHTCGSAGGAAVAIILRKQVEHTNDPVRVLFPDCERK
jgi:hypothetical protein